MVIFYCEPHVALRNYPIPKIEHITTQTKSVMYRYVNQILSRFQSLITAHFWFLVPLFFLAFYFHFVITISIDIATFIPHIAFSPCLHY